MWSKRHEVSYALQRRHTLLGLQRGGATLDYFEACDADPMLLRAAISHGEEAPVRCPVCDCPHMMNLNYVFGDELGQFAGRVKSCDELDRMENEFGEFTVRVVEVCLECGWNHMVKSYVLGDGVNRRPPRRQPTVEDIYG